MIYTGYYAKIPIYLEHGLTPISISGKAPTGYKGLWWKDLAPSWYIWKNWHDGIFTNDQYTELFYRDIISKIDINELKKRLDSVDNPILCCYEKPGDFCHRHIIADFLSASYSVEIKEWDLN